MSKLLTPSPCHPFILSSCPSLLAYDRHRHWCEWRRQQTVQQFFDSIQHVVRLRRDTILVLKFKAPPWSGRSLAFILCYVKAACPPDDYKPVIIIRATRSRLRRRLVLKRVIVLCALVYKSTYAKYTASVRR